MQLEAGTTCRIVTVVERNVGRGLLAYDPHAEKGAPRVFSAEAKLPRRLKGREILLCRKLSRIEFDREEPVIFDEAPGAGRPLAAVVQVTLAVEDAEALFERKLAGRTELRLRDVRKELRPLLRDRLQQLRGRFGWEEIKPGNRASEAAKLDLTKHLRDSLRDSGLEPRVVQLIPTKVREELILTEALRDLDREMRLKEFASRAKEREYIQEVANEWGIGSLPVLEQLFGKLSDLADVQTELVRLAKDAAVKAQREEEGADPEQPILEIEREEILECELSGHYVHRDKMFRCRECGEDRCEHCYVKKANCCARCADERETAREDPAGEAPDDLGEIQRLLDQIREAPQPETLRFWCDSHRSRGASRGIVAAPRFDHRTFLVGDRDIRFQAAPDADGHLYLLAVQSNGASVWLLPNRWRTSCTVREGRRVVLPDWEQDQFVYEATEPVGVDTTLALFSTEPIPAGGPDDLLPEEGTDTLSSKKTCPETLEILRTVLGGVLAGDWSCGYCRVRVSAR